MKEQYRANKAANGQPGEKTEIIGPDGLIESDDEDQKVVLAAKRKVAPSPTGAEATDTGKGSKTEKKAAAPPIKKPRTAA
jgi:hypothetical protein